MFCKEVVVCWSHLWEDDAEGGSTVKSECPTDQDEESFDLIEHQISHLSCGHGEPHCLGGLG